MKLIIQGNIIDTEKIYKIEIPIMFGCANSAARLTPNIGVRMDFYIHFIGKNITTITKETISYNEYIRSKALCDDHIEDYEKLVEEEFEGFKDGFELLLEKWGDKTSYEEIKF